MVHQEHLPLVVPHGVGHGQVSLDHLLGGADGQRCRAGEVLHRGAAAVDRGGVEVGAELAPCVLAVGAHERLAAQAHDRLLGAAVTVVLEALTVELDHLFGVAHGPEEVVVAASCRTTSSGPCAPPHRWPSSTLRAWRSAVTAEPSRLTCACA